MSAFEIERGQKAHCRLLYSDKELTGFFYFDDNTIAADLYQYGGRSLFVPTDQPIHLHTEKNNIVSMHFNIGQPAGRSSRSGNADMIVHHQHVISNAAVIGPDAWLSTDAIKNVTFAVGQTDRLLHHKEKMEKFAKHKIGDDFDYDLFSIQIDGLTVRASYGATYSILHDSTKDIFTHLEVEFDEGVPLQSYLKNVGWVVQLLAASLGVYLQPSKIQISRLTRAEIAKAIDKDEYHSHHAVEYVWPKRSVDDRRIWSGHSFLSAWDDVELANLKACLCVWIQRAPQWQKTYDLMMASLSLQDQFGSERLLTACRWFEEIPTAKTVLAISEDHVSLIAQFASERAIELGYEDMKGRIVGSLRRLGAETNRDRFERLVKIVRARFGGGALDEHIISFLMHAIQFRGRVAHGHFNLESKDEQTLFVRSICALEALSYLLTICDLPMNETSARRALGSPFVQDYHRYPYVLEVNQDAPHHPRPHWPQSQRRRARHRRLQPARPQDRPQRGAVRRADP